MSGFSADWLTLREPVDQRSRSVAILESIQRYFHGRESIRVVDLASGRGSMIRALMPRLPAKQLWYPVDDEPVLLRDAELARTGTIRIEPRLVNLAQSIEDVLSLPADLMVSSAFIDLVSDSWLDRLVSGTVARALPVCLAMSYDGRAICWPSHELDSAVIDAFGRHQRRDKGFGPALGPTAAEVAAGKFRRAGYDVMVERADWHLDPEERDLQTMMVDGWRVAVGEMNELAPHALDAWHERRRAWIAEGSATMTVGHLDVWAVPALTATMDSAAALIARGIRIHSDRSRSAHPVRGDRPTWRA